MHISAFDYVLPEELIAQKPAAKRDRSRMMVIDRRRETITHSRFASFPDYFQPGEILVYNETRVIPARIWGKKADSEIEFLFLKPGSSVNTWEVLCRPAQKVKRGDDIRFAPGFHGEVVDIGEEGRRVLCFNESDVRAKLDESGYAPLPPYIKRKKSQTALREFDLNRYQTVFARRGVAIAAPTAGLHFTKSMLRRLSEKGIISAALSLDVGLATFQPVRVENIHEHRMLEESFSIGKKTADIINQAKREKRAVAAVGTTSVRALESAARAGKVLTGQRSTDLFIYPGFSFHVVDRLLTNFHLPKSSLLMLVSAFAGLELIKEAYRIAVEAGYRFYSYGDCMLIL